MAGPSTPTRISADVAASASAVAPHERRTVAEQINYWARIGMQVERAASRSARDMLEVITGEAQFSSLSAEDRSVAHAVIDARIAERAAGERFGPAARRAGISTVSVDGEGRLIEIAADGRRRTL